MQLSIFNLSPAAIFFSLGFRASVHKPTNNLTTYSLLCWWAQMAQINDLLMRPRSQTF